jgi:hypothetical protein
MPECLSDEMGCQQGTYRIVGARVWHPHSVVEDVTLSCLCGTRLWAHAREHPPIQNRVDRTALPHLDSAGDLPLSLALRGTPYGLWRDGLGDLSKGAKEWTLGNAGRVRPDEWWCRCPSCGRQFHGLTRELLDLIATSRRKGRVNTSLRMRSSAGVPGCDADCCRPPG